MDREKVINMTVEKVGLFLKNQGTANKSQEIPKVRARNEIRALRFIIMLQRSIYGFLRNFENKFPQKFKRLSCRARE